MKRAVSAWSYFPLGIDGQHWFAHGSQTWAVDGPSKQDSSAKIVFAIPTRDLVFVSETVTETTTNAIGKEAIPKLLDLGIRPVEAKGEKCLTFSPPINDGSSTTPSVDFICLIAEPSDAANFLPRALTHVPTPCLFPAPNEDALVLWQEGDELVVACSHGNRWLWVDFFHQESAPEVLEEELLMRLDAMRAQGVDFQARKTIFWTSDPTFAAKWSPVLDDPATITETSALPAPQPLLGREYAITPPAAYAWRESRQKARRLMLSALVCMAILFFGILLALANYWVLQSQVKDLKASLESQAPEADKIEKAMDVWMNLSAAIETSRHPVEILHYFDQSLPAKGIRIEGFQLRNSEELLVRGLADSMNTALAAKAAIETSEALKDYQWTIPPPRVTDSGVKIEMKGTYRY